jgi:hypothetical protein
LPDDGPITIRDVAFVPHPITGSNAPLAVKLSGRGDSFEVRIYTVDLALAMKVDTHGAYAGGWNLVTLDVSRLAGGFYFYSVVAHNGGEVSSRKIGKMAIIR